VHCKLYIVINRPKCMYIAVFQTIAMLRKSQTLSPMKKKILKQLIT